MSDLYGNDDPRAEADRPPFDPHAPGVQDTLAMLAEIEAEIAANEPAWINALWLHLHTNLGSAWTPRSLQSVLTTDDGTPVPVDHIALQLDDWASAGEILAHDTPTDQRHVDRRYSGHPKNVTRPGDDQR